MKLNIRPLAASEWAEFRDFRLHALKSAPGMFGTAVNEELNFAFCESMFRVSGGHDEDNTFFTAFCAWSR